MHSFKRDAETAGEPSPGLDWPQTFVALGVVGVAAWGLWFFMRDRGEDTPRGEEQEPAGLPPLPAIPEIPKPQPEGQLVVPTPREPLPPASPGPPVFLVGDPLQLRSGQHYRARLKLSGMQATFATKELVAGQFLANGFSDVMVYKNARELPQDWPAETKTGGSGVWWVEGNWQGASGPVARQEPIAQVWEA